MIITIDPYISNIVNLIFLKIKTLPKVRNNYIIFLITINSGVIDNMKQFFISALLFSMVFLNGCNVNIEETSGEINVLHELVISEIKNDELIVYKDLNDPTAEYPSYEIKLNDSTDVEVDGVQGSLKDLKINQTVQILLKDGVLEDTKEMVANEIKIIQ